MLVTARGTEEEAWTWPCPYCGTSNSIDAAVCPGCNAQLRDPEEDDLFTTVATDNAQMVDPAAPRVRESLWSTDAPPEELVAEEVLEDVEEADLSAGAQPWPTTATPGGVPQGGVAQAAEATEHQAPAADGPFSRQASAAAPSAGESASAFAPGPSHSEPSHPGSSGPAPGQGGPAPFANSPNAFAREATAPAPSGHEAGHAAFGVTGMPQPEQARPQVPDQGPPPAVEAPPVTPDENGLSVAVERLGGGEREACAVPIGVCGALLGDQEVVLGLLAGHLLGHSAVMMVTNTRILIANARRWKPLLDQFLPSADLTVHVRHDRSVASVTIVQGDRLSTVDDIADVPAALDLAERIRAMTGRV